MSTPTTPSTPRKQTFKVEVFRIAGRLTLDVQVDAPYVDATGRTVAGEGVEVATAKAIAALMSKPQAMREHFDRAQHADGTLTYELFVHDAWMMRSCRTCGAEVEVVLKDENNMVICGACACAKGA